MQDSVEAERALSPNMSVRQLVHPFPRSQLLQLLLCGVFKFLYRGIHFVVRLPPCETLLEDCKQQNTSRTES